VEINYGMGKAFEAALAAEQSKLRGETLWYRLVVGGNTPRYVCLRPRTSLAAILDERADQSLPDKVNGLIAKIDRRDPEFATTCWLTSRLNPLAKRRTSMLRVALTDAPVKHMIWSGLAANIAVAYMKHAHLVQFSTLLLSMYTCAQLHNSVKLVAAKLEWRISGAFSQCYAQH